MGSRKQEILISDIHLHNLDVERRRIYLQEKDDSGENPGVDYRMYQTFIKNLHILQEGLDIEIYLQTGGGCWYSGMAIYDAINNWQKNSGSRYKCTIFGFGMICSMGTIIMQAAKERVLSEHCMFMVHYGSTDASGDVQSMQNYASYQEYEKNLMINIYANRVTESEFAKERGYNLSKVKAFIKRKMEKGDWYMNAEEAVYYGFADRILI